MTELLLDLSPINVSTETEVMRIVVDKRGVTHADYPTATRTLCSLPDENMAPGDNRRPPACDPCRMTAAKQEAIDRCTPAAWFRGGRDPYVPEVLCSGWSETRGGPCRREPAPGRTTCHLHHAQELAAV